MADRVYTTDGLVLGERPTGEAASVLIIFTRDLGLVYVYAAGIRYLKSKLRYHVQPYGLARISLVPGKEYWRLVGAEGCVSLKMGISCTAAVSRVLSRFLGPGEAYPALFDEMIDWRGDELGISLRVLRELGYVAESPSSNAHAQELLDAAIYASHL